MYSVITLHLIKIFFYQLFPILFIRINNLVKQMYTHSVKRVFTLSLT